MSEIAVYSFTLEDITGYSLNALFYGDKRFGWKKEAREWASQICAQVDSPNVQQVFESVRSIFKPSEHVLSVKYEFRTPAMFTATGQISRASMDLDNLCKPITDVLFTHTFNGSGVYKCQNFNIDDQYICELSARKIYADKPSVGVTVSILPLPKKAA